MKIPDFDDPKHLATAPLTVSRYGLQVEKVLMKYIEIFQTVGTKLYWLTTHPNPDKFNMYEDPPGDWRTPELLEAYNNIAKRVASKLNVSVIDVYNVAAVVNDISYDAMHYKAPVGREIAKIVLHDVCVGELPLNKSRQSQLFWP